MTQTEEHTTASTNEPALEIQATPALVKPLLQLWYHETDLELLSELNPFLLHLQRRLGDQVGTSFFCYTPEAKAPTRIDDSEYFRKRHEEDLVKYEQKKQVYQQRHQKALTAALVRLERTVLFVPCCTPIFLEALDRDLDASPELALALANPHFQIMPLLLHPVETGQTFSMRPLSTYAEGDARETALKELVAVMERLLCDALQIQPRTTALDYLCGSPQTVQPVIASEKTTMDLVLAALEPVKHLVEQASTQIVDARQLAMSERSEQQTVQALVQQVEALNQQLQAKQSRFWSRFSRKLE